MEEKFFNEMHLKPELLLALAEKGFESPTPIQAKAIPIALTGKDIIGQAQTGTGKTAAFGLPILNSIKQGEGIQALVLCPTRELAVQVAEELTSLCRKMKIFTLAVYGGQSIELQLRALKRNPEIIVGTPGRLLDHLQRKTIKLHNLEFVVLDEADEMLDMGFLEDINTILEKCPTDRQTFLFSATFSHEIRALALKFMNAPENIVIKTQELTVPLIEQRYYEVNPKQKVETLARIIDVESPQVCMIFCRTKQGVDHLAEALSVRGYGADALHGDLSQRERDAVLSRFRQGIVEILVATDVAARGLDISNVTHVINYDIPQSPDSYVHRIGRTGRAGKQGIAITLVEPREVKQLRYIEQHTKKKITRNNLPTLSDAIEKRRVLITEQIVGNITSISRDYLDLANHLLNNYDSTELLASCIQIIGNQGRQLETAELESATPYVVKIQIPGGKNQGVRAKKIVDVLTSKLNIKPRQIGDIDISDNETSIELPASFATEARAVLKGAGRDNNKKRPSKTKKSLPPGVKPHQMDAGAPPKKKKKRKPIID